MCNGKKCTTSEALLLTGYLFYGEHIYQASSVLFLLVARLVPSKVLRTFNVLLLRWHVDPQNGTLSHALSCTWYAASGENHKLAAAIPVARAASTILKLLKWNDDKPNRKASNA
ncbi:unnamed protein product [Phytophthora lilii]|uniref:Unnamed protein product n=1 Tax=Phytophthora lilii TaxID=2077276 RepID=A0A9W6TF70_9STRA|nr:unnamed protein product [Phytophthora lilii]